MSITTWVDARLAKMAPLVAAAIMADDGPLVQQVQAMLAANEKALSTSLIQAIPSAVNSAVVNLPSQIAQAIKGLLPFPL
jgi:hypothetical protein